jgi:CBS domain-containing protein
MLVEAVMTEPVLTIDADATMTEALDRMLRENVGSLVVTTGSPPRKTGIVTDSDVKSAFHDVENPLEDASMFGRLLFILRQPVTGSPVREYMSQPLITVSPDETLRNAVEMMDEHDVKHLLVTKHKELQGILTPSDVGRVLDDVVDEARRSNARSPNWRS